MKFKYTVHNVLGHPLMEICNLLGFEKLAILIHDKTLPGDWKEDYDNSWDAGEQTDEI